MIAQRRLVRVAAALAYGDARGTRLGADHDGHRGRHGQGRAGRRRSGRDGRADQRDEGHEVGARGDQRRGDYVFPNVTRGHLHRRSDDGGLQDAHAAGRRRSAAATASPVPNLTIEVGGAAETVNVTAEAPLDPVAERRAVVRGHDRADREPADQPRQLHQPRSRSTPASSRRRVGGRHAPRRRRPEQHHDGRRVGHGHRQQRPDAQHEHRVDRRSQGPDAGLPGRVRPVERPADHRRHQERHQPVPRLGLRHRRPTPTGTPTPGSNEKNGDAKPKTTTEDARLHDRRSGRQARRQQQAVLLLRARVPSDDDGDQRRQPDPSAGADGARARGRLLAERSTTTARVRFRRLARLPRRPATAGCFPDGGILGRFRSRCTRSGQPILNRYPLPNVTQAPGTNYNYEIAAPIRRRTT